MKANYDALVTWNTESRVQEKKVICNLKRIWKQLPKKQQFHKIDAS